MGSPLAYLTLHRSLQPGLKQRIRTCSRRLSVEMEEPPDFPVISGEFHCHFRRITQAMPANDAFIPNEGEES